MTIIAYRKRPRVEAPDNAETGLYMEVLVTGYMTDVMILRFVEDDVRFYGYDPMGRGMLGPPCSHGVLSTTRALWFYEKLPAASQPQPKPWPDITVPVISIHHLKGSTVDWIRSMQNDLDFLVAVHDNGLFCVRAGLDSRKTLPPDLCAVMDAADDQVTNGWFALDVDGDVVPGLPLYKD